MTLWFVFFPLQVVLSTCLCFWFCLLPASGWFGDAHRGGWKHLRFLLRSPPGLSLSISVPLFTLVHQRPLHVNRLVPLFFFLLLPANNSPSSSPHFLQICSRPSVPPSRQLPIQVLCHFFTASISRAGTPEETAVLKTVPQP